MMWGMALSAPPAAGAPRPAVRRPPWLRVARWCLYASLGLLGCALAGAAGWIALHAAPGGPTFGWPFRLAARTNVLIMGLDRTVSDQDPRIVYPVSRTDSLIAASFDPASHHIYLLSIPRDTRAAIPGHGVEKINAAHAYGGGRLSMRAVENLTGVRFPYYIEITERGLVHLIDALGGVTIHISKDLNYDDNWDGLHIHLKKGNRRLGGRDAVGYARFRHDALGDIGRIRRQQQLMNAVMDELRRPRVILRAGRVLRVFREDVTTNLTPGQLVALAWFGVRLPPGALVRATLPGEFSPTGDWLPDPVKDRALIARMFYGTDPEVLARATVEVLNAASNRDAVSDPVARMAALGVRVIRIAAAPDAAATALLVHGGDPRVAALIAAALDVHEVVAVAGGNGADLTLIVGKDYADALPPAVTDPPQPSAVPLPVTPHRPTAAPKRPAHGPARSPAAR